MEKTTTRFINMQKKENVKLSKMQQTRLDDIVNEKLKLLDLFHGIGKKKQKVQPTDDV